MLRKTQKNIVRITQIVRFQSNQHDKHYGESFGYKNINKEDRQGMVNQVFDSVASKYDIMNDVMSFGGHRYWKDYFVARINPQANQSIIDGAGGTGDIAFRMLDYVNLGVGHAVLKSSGYNPASEPNTGAAHIGADAVFPHGGPIFGIGKALDKLNLLQPVQQVVRQIPIIGETFEQAESNNLSVTIYDINAEMLKVGAERAVKENSFSKFLDEEDTSIPDFEKYVFQRKQQELNFRECNLETLPEHETGMHDHFTIAFGIRNCTNIDKVLSEAYRVLKPGGRIHILEFSHIEDCEPFKNVYDVYSEKVIPMMGEVVSGDYESYQYLIESIRKFPKQQDFVEMIENAGFEGVRYENLTQGAVAIHSGTKPE